MCAAPCSIQELSEDDHSCVVLPQPLRVQSQEARGAERWAGFIADPDAWLDQRAAKAAGELTPRHPDFVHSRDKRRGLWLNDSTPAEVHKVPETRSCGRCCAGQSEML